MTSRWLPWLAGFVALILYAYTAAPGIVTFFDDTLEFQTVAPTFGITHPTGYPLYTLLGGLWTRLLPFGTWAGRLNLFSALCAAITIGFVFAITSRLATQRNGAPNHWAGLAAATTFALGPVWWSQATLAEVYTLHGAFVAAILATTIGMNQGGMSQGDLTPFDQAKFDRRMALLCLLFGFGLTHHRTTLLLAPPVALYLLWSVPSIWRPRRVWWLWGAALLLPLILYLYIPLRAAAGVRDLNGSYVPSWAGFWNHVLARDYNTFFADNELAAALTPGEWLDLIRTQTGWLGLGLAGLGLLWLVDRRGRPARAWWLILGVLLANLLFALVYLVPDPQVFLLPAILCLALFSGGGVGLLARFMPKVGSLSSANVLAALVITALVFIPLGRGPATNRRDIWTVHDRARRMAQAAFPPNSQVIGIEGEVTALRYLQAAESLGTNATPIAANDLVQRRTLIDNAMAQGIPLYLTRDLEGIANVYSFSGEADLIRVWPRGESQITLPSLRAVEPIPAQPPLQLGDGRVQIEAYEFHPIAGVAQPAQELILYWRVLSPTDKTLKLSLRLLDETGAQYEWPDGRAAIEDRFPLRRVALTPDWQPGELIQDVHTVQLPPLLQEAMKQAKLSTLLVIIYDGATSLEEGRIEIMF